MVRGLASHQCGLGSIRGPGAICGLSRLLLVLSLLREVFSGYSGFPLSQKPTFLNSNSIRNPRTTGLSVARLLGATLVKTKLIYSYYFFPSRIVIPGCMDSCTTRAVMNSVLVSCKPIQTASRFNLKGIPTGIKERISIEYLTTKTKVTTLANHNRHKQRNEPITTPRKYM